MTAVVITGYSSIDYVVQLASAPLANLTTHITHRPGDLWPRPGGSPYYVARGLIQSGIRDALPVTWVADDAEGAGYVRSLAGAGMPVEGVSWTVQGRSPVCILAYDDAGRCYCLYDAGSGRTATLDRRQEALIDGADWVCVTVGPATATRATLARLQPAQHLAWVIKGDAEAFPEDLRDALALRSDLIVLNREERTFLGTSLEAARGKRPGPVLIETVGAHGVVLELDGRRTEVAIEPVPAPDPTGAGDTFVGGVIAALIRTPDDPVAAVRAGVAAARALLLGRLGNRKEGKAR